MIDRTVCRGALRGVAALAAVFSLGLSARAAVIYVDDSAVGTNNGSSWANAYVSFQSALTAAVSGDEIWVAAGTYNPSSYNGMDPGDPVDVRRMHFRMKNGVGIYGGFDGTEDIRDDRNWRVNITTLSADIGIEGDSSDNCYRVFYHPATDLGSDSILDGFSIVDANADGATAPYQNGGGFFIWGGSNGTSPQIRNCQFLRNHADTQGGGIYLYGGNHEPANCFPRFEGCIIEQNTSDDTGAGAHVGYRGNATFLKCEFRENQAGTSGGGIYAIRNEIQVVNCLFAQNSAIWGGGFYGSDTASDGVNPNITNCTMVENSASGQGGGLHLVDYPGLTLGNSIVWGNTAVAGPQIYEVNDDPTFVYNCIQDGGFAGAGNITDDPGFADALGEDWRLTLVSPCVDVGSNLLVPEDSTEDLDGVPRFIDGNLDGFDLVDIGAYEFFQTRSLTMVVNPPAFGETDPSVGVHANMMAGVRFPIVATPSVGSGFAGWRVTAGDASISGTDLAQATVLLFTDAEVTVDFMEMLSPGRVFEVAAGDLALPSFTLKPKVYGQYDHPVIVGKLGLKAAAKVLTKVDKAGTDPLDCEWTKKIKLYDAKVFKAAQKGGESAAAWVPVNQENLPVVLHAASKEIADGDQPLRSVLLAAPEILTATVSAPEAVTVVTLEGNWFGTKKPKVWREYNVEDGLGGAIVKQQTMKVVKPTVDNTDCLDSKLKPAYMDAETGASKVIVVVPAKDPKGVLNDVIVIDNGVGMGTVMLP